MKKTIIGLLALLVFMITVPSSAEAQSCACRTRSYRTVRYTPRYRTVRYVPRYRTVRYVRYVPTYRTVRYTPRYRTARYAPAYRTARYAPSYRTAGYTYSRPSFYRRHRNFINIGAATGGGAILGALIGGRRGAGIGALLGGGGGALYTYKLHPKRRRY